MQNETKPHESPEQILSPKFLSRFWSRVNKTDTCWLWTGSRITSGYGHLGVWKRQMTVYSHRASWIIHNGPIPDGRQVLHNCPGGDNPACVNPAHLWLGGHPENMHDMASKGRAARAKLNVDQVRTVRQLRVDGMTYKRIGSMVGLHRSSISDLVNRRTWRHVS